MGHSETQFARAQRLTRRGNRIGPCPKCDPTFALRGRVSREGLRRHTPRTTEPDARDDPLHTGQPPRLGRLSFPRRSEFTNALLEQAQDAPACAELFEDRSASTMTQVVDHKGHGRG